jgi:hypothetical protein
LSLPGFAALLGFYWEEVTMVFQLLNWEVLLAAGGTLFFLYALYYLDKRGHKARQLGIDEYIAKMARLSECSEYDVFHAAAEEWQISKSKVESDFKHYLLQDNIPFYVKDFVRRYKSDVDQIQDIPPY